jgi:hypothetical protein
LLSEEKQPEQQVADKYRNLSAIYFFFCKKVNESDPRNDRASHSGVVSVDPKLKKYILCFLKKTGIATEASDNNMEVLKRLANDEEVEKMVQK